MGLDLEVLRQTLAQRSHYSNTNKKSTDDYYFFPLKEEISPDQQVIVRYLPPCGNAKQPGKIIYKHTNLPNVKDGKEKCMKTYGMDCPICDVLREYEKQLDVNPYLSKGRANLNGLVLQDPTYAVRNRKPLDPTKPHIINVFDNDYYWLVEKLLDPNVGDITDPRTGHNVIYQRKRDGKFDRTIVLKGTPIANTEEGIQEILGKMYDFEKMWGKADDVIYNRIKDAAGKLRASIEERLMTLKSQNQVPGPMVAPISQSATASAQIQAPESQTQVAKKPNNTPQCFGNAAVFYKNELTGEDDPNKAKCVSCPFDFLCGEEIKKRK